MAAGIAASGAQVHGIDISQESVETARQNLPQLSFEVADAQDFEASEPFDAVFSNGAMLFMSRDPGAVLANVRRALRPGGRFVAETPGAGNCAEAVEVLRLILADLEVPEDQISAPGGLDHWPPWFLPTRDEQAARLESAGFKVERIHRYEVKASVVEMGGSPAGWLREFGDEFLALLPAEVTESVLARFEDVARRVGKHETVTHALVRFVATR